MEVVRVNAVANLKNAQVWIRDEEQSRLLELCSNRSRSGVGDRNEDAPERFMKSFIEQKWLIHLFCFARSRLGGK